MSDEASPRPWRVAELDRRCVEDANGNVAADIRGWRDGIPEMVVRAVNAWDDPEALRGRMKELGLRVPYGANLNLAAVTGRYDELVAMVERLMYRGGTCMGDDECGCDQHRARELLKRVRGG